MGAVAKRRGYPTIDGERAHWFVPSARAYLSAMEPLVELPSLAVAHLSKDGGEYLGVALGIDGTVLLWGSRYRPFDAAMEELSDGAGI